MFSNMRYIYEVYKEGSFSKAARNLYISQPALSATVKKTESKIGMPLFDRSMNPIQLTECGKKYIKMTEKMMDMEEEFASYVGNLNELRTGRLSIGGTFLFMAFILPNAIQKFHKTYPNVKMNVVEGHTSQLEKKLFSGDLDLIVDNYPMDPEIYEKRFFMKEHLLLAVPASFQSNRGAEIWGLKAEDILNQVHIKEETLGVPLKLFENDPFVVLRAHNDTRERVEAICKRAGITPQVTLKLDQLLMTYQMTEKEMGISFVSDTVVRSQRPNSNIIYYKLDDPAAERSVYFWYKKNKYFTKSMAEFMKMAVEDVQGTTSPANDV